jgi:hypothetical protein
MPAPAAAIADQGTLGGRRAMRAEGDGAAHAGEGSVSSGTRPASVVPIAA